MLAALVAFGQKAFAESLNKKVEVSYPTYSKVGYFAEYLGETTRKPARVSNGGLARYPVYGTVLANTTEDERKAIIAENDGLNASANTYDLMDADGNLYLNGTKTGKKLYKHSAAEGMYFGNVDDSQKAVIKRLHYKSRPAGDHITGLYAPAGEVIKIEISQSDLEKTGGIKVLIGQALQNEQANNIWSARSDMSRMPIILNKMTVNTTTGYVGSYLGGPIYIKPVKAGTEFTVTISGAVTYPHFILGYTTEEEYAKNKSSSAPYFDLEVWDDAVRHSGPRTSAESFSYSDLYDAAVLWEKIASVSNRVPTGSNGEIGIGFFYDTFVAAGSACAFVGRSSINCPISWMKGSLDYQSFTASGSWGAIHEYNHHYSRFGLEGSGAYPSEVTNNAVSLVSYSLFTDISSYRTLDGIKTPSGEDWWNSYTVPSLSLKKTLDAYEKGAKNTALDTYANILHSFGQENFLNATAYGKGEISVDKWFEALCETTKYDMTYYFTELLHADVSAELLQAYKAKNYPMYVPVASVYQTGVSYFDGKNKKFSTTVRPFAVTPAEENELDFAKSIVLPQGFSFEIKEITNPENGEFKKPDNSVCLYTPDGYKNSGEFTVTISITKDDGEFSVKDVTFTINLSVRKNLLQRTVYTYDDASMYKTATEAYDGGYAGYSTKKVENNVNPTQNGNAEIWVPNPTKNAVMEIAGKIYIPADGKYRFIVRGRTHANLYLSTDGGNSYSLGGVVNKTSGANFWTEDPTTYTDLTLKAGDFVYFKAVLLVTDGTRYIGVGWGKFNGDTVNVGYLTNAYRQEFDGKVSFESESKFGRDYTEALPELDFKKGQTLISSVYTPWDDTKKIENLFDEDETNHIHSDKTSISAENPFEMTVALEKEVTANKFTIYGEPTRAYQPKTFTLYGGIDLENMSVIAEVEAAVVKNGNIVIKFDDTQIKYYKLRVTDTYANKAVRYIAFRTAAFSYECGRANLFSPDEDKLEFYGDWQKRQALSTFGHIYGAEGSAKLKFGFVGKRFALYALAGTHEGNFEVSVDGKKVDCAIETLSSEKLAYLSPILQDGKHSVEITAKSGFGLDCIGVIGELSTFVPTAGAGGTPPAGDGSSGEQSAPEGENPPKDDTAAYVILFSIVGVLVIALAALIAVLVRKRLNGEQSSNGNAKRKKSGSNGRKKR